MEAATKGALAGGGSSCDRLSALPDDLLHRVLSFLPTLEVVQTSLLSKRWTGTWRSAPCLSINIRDFPITCGDSIGFQVNLQWAKMRQFTTDLLRLHDAPALDAFRFEIDWVDRDRIQALDRLVRRAITYRPSVLEVVVLIRCFQDPYEFRNLGGSGSCRLKSLHLYGLSLDTSFAEQLRSGCPVLEDLQLRDCDCKFREIQSSTLKNLAIRVRLMFSVGMLVIRAPALASLNLSIYGDNVSVDRSTNSLATASISVNDRWPHVPPGFITLTNRVELLRGLSNVTNLELSGFWATVMLDEDFDIFKNLRILSLRYCLGKGNGVVRELKVIGRFLQKAPNLEKLTLENCWFSDYLKDKKNKRKTSEIPLDSPDQKAFEFQNLKLIEINYIGHRGLEDDQVFQIMQRLWRNLQRATFNLIKMCST